MGTGTTVYIDDLNAGLASLHTALRGEPSAAAQIRFAILGFSTDVAVRLALTDPRSEPEFPPLRARDVTNYGAAFTELLTRIPADVAGPKAADFRVCRPVVFFITDGKPTDHWEAHYERLVNRETTEAAPDIIAWGIGEADARTILRVASREEFAYVSNKALPLREAVAQFCVVLTATLTTSGRSLARGEIELVVECPRDSGESSMQSPIVRRLVTADAAPGRRDGTRRGWALLRACVGAVVPGLGPEGPFS